MAGVGLIAAAAAASRLLPGIVSSGVTARLSAPITYWNGLAALVAVGTVLALGLASDARRPAYTRVLAAAIIPLFLLDLLLTYSRGATIALFLGLLVLVWLRRDRLDVVVTGTLLALLTVPLLLYASSQPSIARLTSTAPIARSEAHHVLLVLVLTAVVAAMGAYAVGQALTRALPRHRRFLTRGAATLAVLALIAAGYGAVTHHPISWVRQQADAFRRFDPGARNGSSTIGGRLAVAAGSGRWQFWSVAAHEFKSSPLRGAGAGSFRFAWDKARPVDLDAVNAHSLYLETLADSGLIGLALLILPGAAVLAGVRRRWRNHGRRAAPRDTAAVIAAGAVLASHFAVDWDWQLPAVVIPVMLLGGALLRAVTSREPSEERVRRLAVLALCCPIAIAFALGPLESARSVDRAKAAAGRGNLTKALTIADHAKRLDPASSAPRLLLAYVLRDLGRPTQAESAFAEALARSPNDWTIAAGWAEALLARGDIDAAAILVRRAQRLNPLEPRVQILANVIRADQKVG